MLSAFLRYVNITGELVNNKLMKLLRQALTNNKGRLYFIIKCISAGFVKHYIEMNHNIDLDNMKLLYQCSKYRKLFFFNNWRLKTLDINEYITNVQVDFKSSSLNNIQVFQLFIILLFWVFTSCLVNLWSRLVKCLRSFITTPKRLVFTLRL